MIKDSIFIPIAACEERFIEQTVRSALFHAENPDNIYFGIFNNIVNKEHSLYNNDFITKNKQILYVEAISPSPLGVGFGRMNASLLQFRDFEYMFQIDAHTLFTQKWDTKIIEAFNIIKNENDIEEDKIILSAIPPIAWFYNEDNLNKILSYDFDNNIIFEIDPYNLEDKFLSKINDGLISPRILYDGKQGEVFDLDNINFPITYGEGHLKNLMYKEVNCIHASFMFSKCNLNINVLHDPKDSFNGDQTNYGIRLLSRGYRIFCPKYPVIATLNKFISKTDNFKEYSEPIDKEHNWRTYNINREKVKNIDVGMEYYGKLISNDRAFFNDLISGKYFGYWGTPDQQSLDKIKKIINYPMKDKL